VKTGGGTRQSSPSHSSPEVGGGGGRIPLRKCRFRKKVNKPEVKWEGKNSPVSLLLQGQEKSTQKKREGETGGPGKKVLEFFRMLGRWRDTSKGFEKKKGRERLTGETAFPREHRPGEPGAIFCGKLSKNSEKRG